MFGNKKILIVSEANLIQTFVQTTVEKIREETGAGFDCFITTPINSSTKSALSAVFNKVYVAECPKGVVGEIPKVRVLQIVTNLRHIAKQLPLYDIIHIHFHHFYYAFISGILRRKAGKFYLTFYGGDFDNISNFRHAMNRRTIGLTDGVFAENEKMLEKIVAKYQLSGKQTGVLRFMMTNFVSFESYLLQNTREQARKLWDDNKKIIVCGYSGGEIMRHREMIDALNSLNGHLAGYKAIFPMTYGWRADAMRAIVSERLADSSFDADIIEHFLPVEKLHALRLAAEIFINIQVRDQLSSSMMEHLAAGSVVITGKWFPYGNLIEKGIFMVQIDKPEDLAIALAEVLNNIIFYKERAAGNREIILKMTNWAAVKSGWYHYYGLDS